MVGPKDFKRQLDTHDWHYHYSDDPRYYSRGEANQSRLEGLAASNPQLQKIYDEHKKGGK